MKAASRISGLLLDLPPDNRVGRFIQLYAGLLIYGISSSLMVLGRRRTQLELSEDSGR